MRYIITPILIINTFLSYSQTKLDSLILNEINDYRLRNGVERVDIGTIAFKCASVQSDTILSKGYVTHANSGELKILSDRLKFFGGKTRNFKIAEICNLVSVGDTNYIQKIAVKIVNSWKSSEKHNRILIDPEYNFVGVSSKIHLNHAYTTAVFVK